MREKLYSIRDIAEATGKTVRGLRKRSRNGNKRAGESPWEAADTIIRRGQETKLYSLSKLPPDIRQALREWEKICALEAISEQAARDQAAHEQAMARNGEALAQEKARRQREAVEARARRIADGQKKYNALADDDPRKQRAKGRLWFVLAVIELCRRSGMARRVAITELARQVNERQIDVPAYAEAAITTNDGARSLSHGTLKNWCYDYANGGVWALTPGWYGHKRSKIEKTPALKALVLGALLKYPQITGRSIKNFLEAEHPELNICSVRAIQRFIRQWKDENQQIWTYLRNPDQWKNVYMAAAGSVFEQIDRPNQLWELDSTPGDWLLTDGRHSVIGCIDLYSRRVKLFVSKSSTAAAVKQVMRRAMLDWGVPEVVRTDNGKDYVSQDITGLLRDLEIIQEICIPFASEEKGTIERFFRTMSHGLLNLLDGFIGHSVADRKAIEARKSFAQRIMEKDAVVEVRLSSDELQQKLNDWVSHFYEQEPHGGLNGRSPIEVWRAWNRPLRRIHDEHALDGLMMPYGQERVIGKKGLRFNNRFYIDPTGRMHVAANRNNRVYFRYDEHDLGRIAVYQDGAFLCWAVDPDAVGIDRREAAAAIKHHQKKVMAEQAKELKKYARALKQDIAQTVIDYRKEQTENIVDFPRASEEYSTPALEEAARAHQELINPPQPHNSQADVVGYDQFRGEFERHNESVLEETDLRRIHAGWLRVEQAIEAGDIVSEDDRRGLEAYRLSGQYQSQQELFEAFGLTAEDFQ
jgi:hypothetical protein